MPVISSQILSKPTDILYFDLLQNIFMKSVSTLL